MATVGRMMLTTSRRKRIEARVDELIHRVEECLGAFDEARVFTGPSVFFHIEAVRRRRSLTSLRVAIDDQPLLVSIYATLTSWGMHRMGPRGPKLVAFDVFAGSLREQEERLLRLEALRLEELKVAEITEVAGSIWDALMGVSVSATESRLVAGTKALHHLLPDLLPPMDRRYTDGFFLGADQTFNSQAFQKDPAAAFAEVFPQMARIVRECHRSFAKRIGSGFHTSLPKCVDNAIVGYVLLKRGRAAAELLEG
jgi:hypothetical protein